MGILDKLKDAASGHEEQVNQAIDQAGDAVDQKTGGQYEGQVDQAQDFLKDKIGEAEPRQ